MCQHIPKRNCIICQQLDDQLAHMFMRWSDDEYDGWDDSELPESDEPVELKGITYECVCTDQQQCWDCFLAQLEKEA